MKLFLIAALAAVSNIYATSYQVLPFRSVTATKSSITFETTFTEGYTAQIDTSKPRSCKAVDSFTLNRNEILKLKGADWLFIIYPIFSPDPGIVVTKKFSKGEATESTFYLNAE